MVERPSSNGKVSGPIPDSVTFFVLLVQEIVQPLIPPIFLSLSLIICLFSFFFGIVYKVLGKYTKIHG